MEVTVPFSWNWRFGVSRKIHYLAKGEVGADPTSSSTCIMICFMRFGQISHFFYYFVEFSSRDTIHMMTYEVYINVTRKI